MGLYYIYLLRNSEKCIIFHEHDVARILYYIIIIESGFFFFFGRVFLSIDGDDASVKACRNVYDEMENRWPLQVITSGRYHPVQIILLK